MGAIVAGMDSRGDSTVCLCLLEELLLPLHSPNGMVLWRDQTPVLGMYHEALVFALVKVVEVFYESEAFAGAQQSVLVAILRGLFRQWPRGFSTNTPKEVLLLHEVDMLLRYCNTVDFAELLPEIADLLSRSFAHDNAVPMQRALEFFKNEVFLRLVGSLGSNQKELLVAALLPSLYRGGTPHWSPTVNKMSAQVLFNLRSAATTEFDAFALRSFTPFSPTKEKRPRPAPPRPIPKPVYSAAPLDPLTRTVHPITVAPWARPQDPSPEKRHAPTLSDGLAVLLDYMSRCRGRDELESQELSQEPRPIQLKFHDLVFGKELGNGAFSVVRYAKRIIRDRPQSRWPEYAVKVISPATSSDLSEGKDPNDALFASLREITILRMVDHSCIARLVSSFRYRSCVYIVLELASKGDLHTYIMRRGAIEEHHTRFILGEVASALLAVHEKGLVFNDLKPENVLLCSSNHIKLTDFGACRPVTPQGKKDYQQLRISYSDLMNGDWRDENIENRPMLAEEFEDGIKKAVDAIEGTPGYQPPELLKCKVHYIPFPAQMDIFLNDAWALGCIMSFCLNGKPLFYGSAEEVLLQMESILNPQSRQVHFDNSNVEGCLSLYHARRQGISEHALQLLDALLAIDVKERCSVVDAALSTFLTDCGKIDPKQLHLQEAVELPSILEARNVDQAWARRQLSVVWAPMPSLYSFVGQNHPSIHNRSKTITGDTDIPEIEDEKGIKF